MRMSEDALRNDGWRPAKPTALHLRKSPADRVRGRLTTANCKESDEGRLKNALKCCLNLEFSDSPREKKKLFERTMICITALLNSGSV